MSDAPEWEGMADWSNLPDVYVTKVECQQGMFWRVEACSIPMVLLPELRLIRADLAAAKDARIADLERQLAEAREVKPLEWTRGIVDWAEPMPSMQYVACSTHPPGCWSWWLEGAEHLRTVERDETAAKAAAQADYEARILSALKGAKP